MNAILRRGTGANPQGLPQPPEWSGVGWILPGFSGRRTANQHPGTYDSAGKMDALLSHWPMELVGISEIKQENSPQYS